MSTTPAELLPEDSVRAVTDEIFASLVGEEEVLVPLQGELPEQTVSAWVGIDGPWSGRVVLTCAPGTAEEGWAVPVLRDPRTGEAVMTGDAAMPFTRLPGECDFDDEVLCAEVAVEGGDRIVA